MESERKLKKIEGKLFYLDCGMNIVNSQCQQENFVSPFEACNSIKNLITNNIIKITLYNLILLVRKVLVKNINIELGHYKNLIIFQLFQDSQTVPFEEQ